MDKVIDTLASYSHTKAVIRIRQTGNKNLAFDYFTGINIYI